MDLITKETGRDGVTVQVAGNRSSVGVWVGKISGTGTVGGGNGFKRLYGSL